MIETIGSENSMRHIRETDAFLQQMEKEGIKTGTLVSLVLKDCALCYERVKTLFYTLQEEYPKPDAAGSLRINGYVAGRKQIRTALCPDGDFGVGVSIVPEFDSKSGRPSGLETVVDPRVIYSYQKL